MHGAFLLSERGDTVNRMNKKYPAVFEPAGYVPGWVKFFVRHPVIGRVCVSVPAFISAMLSALLILRKL